MLAILLAFLRGSASEAMKIANYDTNLTDAQWAYLQPMLPTPSKLGRPPKDRRRIMDAKVVDLIGPHSSCHFR